MTWSREVDRLLGELKQVVDTDVAAFNEMVAEFAAGRGDPSQARIGWR